MTSKEWQYQRLSKCKSSRFFSSWYTVEKKVSISLGLLSQTGAGEQRRKEQMISDYIWCVNIWRQYEHVRRNPERKKKTWKGGNSEKRKKNQTLHMLKKRQANIRKSADVATTQDTVAVIKQNYAGPVSRACWSNILCQVQIWQLPRRSRGLEGK